MVVRDALLHVVKEEARTAARQVAEAHPGIPSGFGRAVGDASYASDLQSAAESLDLGEFEWFQRFLHVEVWNSLHPDHIYIYGHRVPRPVGSITRVRFSWTGPGTLEILEYSAIAIGVNGRRSQLLPKHDPLLEQWWEECTLSSQRRSPYWQDRARVPSHVERWCWLWKRRAELRAGRLRGFRLYAQLRTELAQREGDVPGLPDEWSIQRELQRLHDKYLMEPDAGLTA